ncbi:MAG: hypothetical protein LBS40_04755 [Burkholderiales bacterium]|nr:hypothetical protein [Burkholderiales bacterium]
MVIARLLFFFAIAVLALGIAAYLITGNRRYLMFCKRVLIFSVVFFLIMLLFFVFERLILVL